VFPFQHERLEVLPPPPLTTVLIVSMLAVQAVGAIAGRADEARIAEAELRLRAATGTTAADQAERFARTDELTRLVQRRPEWRFGFVPAEPLVPETSIAHPFVHLSWLHLFANLVWLWFVAGAVERRSKKIGFAIVLVLGVLGSASAHAWLADDAVRAVPLVGASGLTMAFAGAFVVTGPRDRVRWFVPPVFRFWAPAWALAVPLSAAEVLHLALETGAASFAHAGGAAAGVAAGLVLFRR
jgi:membrane associated rhomboid family serine protease